MIYAATKLIVGFAVRQFFSSIKVQGAVALEKGPLILVANHPNQAMDSLLVGCVMKRDLWFLAKAALFKNPLLRHFFTACHMLPVQRRGDSADGAIDNKETFKAAVAKLSQGGAVVVFPEGTSLGERRMLPLKTGAARIAFQAEEAHNFNLGLRIQAVGITYSELYEFRSAVTMTFADPISVNDFKCAYETNAMQAVRDLTAKAEERLRSVTVGLSDQRHNDLVEKITAIYRSAGSASDEQKLMLTVAHNVEQLSDAQQSSEIETRIKEYCELAAVFAVDGNVVFNQDLDHTFDLLITPFMMLAFLINFLPYRLVGNLALKNSSEPVYIATNKFAYGFLVFSLWYLFIGMLVFALTGSTLYSTAAFAACLALGYLINNYSSRYKIFLLSSLWPGRKKPIELIKLMRDQLIEELNGLRVK